MTAPTTLNVRVVRKAVEAEDTFLQNQIDEVVQLCSQTIYKLKFLK